MLRSSRNNRNGKNRSNGNSINRRLGVEKLEERALLAGDLSISDASAVEGNDTGHFRSAFVKGNFNTLVFGPDSNLYAIGGGQGYLPWEISRYDGTTGAFIDTFASVSTGNQFRDMIFHTDGYLYVASSSTDEILRFDAVTGAYFDVFVSAASGGIDAPDGLSFGPDFNLDGIPELYATGWLSHSVVRYNGATGQPLGTYIAPGSGGLSSPFDLEFGPGGVYVTSAGTSKILKYDAVSGAFLGVAASSGLDYPRDLTFGPDGLMYVVSGNNDRILRFAASGAYVDDYVPAGAGGMDNPRSLAFGPDGDLYVAAHGNDRNIYRYGTQSEVVFTVSIGATSLTPVSVEFATANGIALAGTDYTTASGTITFAPGETRRTILVQTLDDAAAEPTETFTVNLSNPVGATIADGLGVATILDNDPFTKFYVVNDGATTPDDQTFEYQASGVPISSNGLVGSGNSAPRGAASTAAGDKVWVVDANKKVYVYDTNGSPLVNWTAGSLQAGALVEGIATNGTDVWIVDNKADRVYRYANAASALSSTVIATSSFNLNSGNKNPKDIVTDGTYLWVVNDSTTDKVFKYTIAGVYVGSWTITTPNVTSPTGITLDPTKVSHLWIVDNGTDRVYQYNTAAGLTSGSKSADSDWALATGNTNPQGIADPPPPSSGLNAAPASPVSHSAFSSRFMQAPVVLLGVPSTERVASLQSGLAIAEEVDEYMSQLASLLSIAPISVSKVPSMPLNSRTRFAEDHSIDLALADDELDDSLHAIANDLLESTLR